MRVILICAVLVFSACHSHTPPVPPDPTPTPTPVPIEQWEKNAKATFGPYDPAYPWYPDPFAGEVWHSMRKPIDRQRIKAIRDQFCKVEGVGFYVEVPLFLDSVWNIETAHGKTIGELLLTSPKMAMEALKTEIEWMPFMEPGHMHNCPYSLYDTLMMTAYARIPIELNFDTMPMSRYVDGEWVNTGYHKRPHWALELDPSTGPASHGVYAKMVRHVLTGFIQDWQRWQKRNGYPETIPVFRVCVENEPAYTKPHGCNNANAIYTQATYLERVRRTRQTVQAKFGTAIQIMASHGCTGIDWAIAAYKQGHADKLGFHGIWIPEEASSLQVELNILAQMFGVFEDNGIALSDVVNDEALSQFAYRDHFKFHQDRGLGGFAWTTMVGSGKQCHPHWALYDNGRGDEIFGTISTTPTERRQTILEYLSYRYGGDL